MKEIITDELLTEFAHKYTVAKIIAEKMGNKMIDFGQFVNLQIQARAVELRKGGFNVEI